MTYGDRERAHWQRLTPEERAPAEPDPLHGLNFPAAGQVEDLATLTEPPPVLALTGRTQNIARLKDWPPIETVWLADATHDQFARIAAHLNPVNLQLGYIRTPDFSPIAHLDRLEGFALDQNTKVTDLTFLSRMTGLKRLTLHDISKPVDLAPLASLTQLQLLTLSGGIWNKLRVPSLAPLAALKHVERLDLINIAVGDESLAPLIEMSALRHLHVSNQFPTETYAHLHAARPDIACDKFAPYEHIFVGQDEEGYMVTGKRKPVIKPGDEPRLQKYIDQWEKLVATFRGDL